MQLYYQVELEDDQQAVDEPDLHLAYLTMAGRVRRLSKANHMCLALCLTIVTMLGLMAGMHVYRTVFIRRYNYTVSEFSGSVLKHFAQKLLRDIQDPSQSWNYARKHSGGSKLSGQPATIIR